MGGREATSFIFPRVNHATAAPRFAAGEGRKVRGKIGGQIRVEVCVECRGEKGDGEKESRSRVRTEGEICISRERNNRCHLMCLLPNVRSTDAV